MCGYTGHTDGRLIPSDINDSDEPTPAECWVRCVHGNACRMQLTELSGGRICWYGTPVTDQMARVLGCEDCDEWREDNEPELKRVCSALVSRLHYAEQQLNMELIDARLANDLKGLDVKV